MNPGDVSARPTGPPSTRCVLVAITGGSGSGKTWLAEKLNAVLGSAAMRISLDDFYRDRSYIPLSRRTLVNFDHPRAIDWPLFECVLRSLATGRSANLPRYDFTTHCRLAGGKRVPPSRVVLVEGLWLLRRPAVRRLFAFSIYLDCPVRTRLQRRLARDLASRGRTAAAVRRQFRSVVEPMHRQYVAPQARLADTRLRACGLPEVRRLARFISRLAGRSIASR